MNSPISHSFYRSMLSLLIFAALFAVPLEAAPAETLGDKLLTAVEKKLIQRAMVLADNVQTEAAKRLGIGKSGLNQKIKKYGLQ